LPNIKEIIKKFKWFFIVFLVLWTIVAIFFIFFIFNQPKYDYENLTEQQIIEGVGSCRMISSSFEYGGNSTGAGAYTRYDYDHIRLSFKKMTGSTTFMATNIKSGQMMKFYICGR